MIRLRRPKNPPKHLLKNAPAAVAELWKEFSQGVKLNVKKSIYGSTVVRQALIKAQSNKCAYCETIFVRDHPQVEHFRPKTAWKQRKEDVNIYPGYFWLSYDWSNLLLSCSMCNDNGHKSSLFPLENIAHRATHSKPDISKEKPLLLNPFKDDPFSHIKWNRDVPIAVSGSSKGDKTIDTFGLKTDEALIDFRRTHLLDLELKLRTVETGTLTPTIQKKYITILRKSIKKGGAYSAMVSANLGARIMALKR